MRAARIVATLGRRLGLGRPSPATLETLEARLIASTAALLEGR